MGESAHHKGDVLADGEVRHAGVPQSRQESVSVSPFGVCVVRSVKCGCQYD